MKFWNLLFFLLLTMLISCHETNIKKPLFLVGFSQCTGADEWRRQMDEAMLQELEFHPEIKFLYKDANDNNDVQIAQIEELIAQKVDLLIVSPNESEPLTAVVDKAFQSGIPVILIDRKTNSDNYTSFVGADNYEVGFNAGEIAAILLKGKGHVFEIFGLKGSSPAIDRHNGFVDALKSYPDIRITKQVFSNWFKEDAYAKLQQIVSSNDSINLVFAHNDAMAMAAYEAYDSLCAENIYFIGIDGLPGKGNGIDMVNKAFLSATVLYPTGGEETIRLAADILNGKNVPKKITLSSTVIDSKNSRIMFQQSGRILEQKQNIIELANRIENQFAIYSDQRRFLYGLSGGMLILLALLVKLGMSYRTIRSQKKLIEKQNAHLAELNKTKDKFFRIIAHDLRSPFNALIGLTHLLLNSEKENNAQKRQEMLQMLNTTAQNTYALAENLLTWAKLQMNELGANKEKVDVKELITLVYGVYEEPARNKEIKLEYYVDESLYFVVGDKNQLEFVVRNLVNNAIKFTPNGGRVSVSVSPLSNGGTRIQVTDTGVGIPDEIKDSLFLLGTNRSTEGTAGEKGTGLGLMLCFEFIKHHQGTIQIESKPGGGTVFAVDLPEDTLVKNSVI